MSKRVFPIFCILAVCFFHFSSLIRGANNNDMKNVLATVNGEPITMEDYYHSIGNRPSLPPRMMERDKDEDIIVPISESDNQPLTKSLLTSSPPLTKINLDKDKLRRILTNLCEDKKHEILKEKI